MERGCCEFICDAPTTAQGYVIEQNRLGLGILKVFVGGLCVSMERPQLTQKLCKSVQF